MAVWKGNQVRSRWLKNLALAWAALCPLAGVALGILPAWIVCLGSLKPLLLSIP